MNQPIIHIANDAQAWSTQAAKLIANVIAETFLVKDVCSMAVSGGRTPQPVLEQMRSITFAADKTLQVFWVDERCVPPDHEDSNYRLVHEAWLRHSPAVVHYRMQGEKDPQEAADAYADLLREKLKHYPVSESISTNQHGISNVQVKEQAGRHHATHDTQHTPYATRHSSLATCHSPFPCFDLVLLGLGNDGHTASLFPGHEVLAERESWVAAPYVAKLQAHRITLTFPVLNRTHRVFFLVAGAAKQDVVQAVVEWNGTIAELPALGVTPDDGELVWILDREAAGTLTATKGESHD